MSPSLLFVHWLIEYLTTFTHTFPRASQGSKASSQALESFADKLSETFVNGELAIGDWTPDKGAKINVNTLNLMIFSTKHFRLTMVIAYTGTSIQTAVAYSPGRIVPHGGSVSRNRAPE
jgi:hypothetical protein